MTRFLLLFLFITNALAACRNVDSNKAEENESGYEENEGTEPEVANRNKPEPVPASYLAVAQCDSISVKLTYTHHIRRIVNTRCAITACHDASTKANGIEMTDYAKTRDVFEHGKGFCSILHDNEANCRHMPTVRFRLPERHIAQILCWAKSGYTE